MGKVLSFELHKLFRTKSFYVWTTLSAALSVLFLLMYYGFYQTVQSPEVVAEISADGEAIPFLPENGIMSMVQMFGKSPMVFCILVFICSFACSDFENGILKNIISKGYRREAIFTAKYITVLVASFIMTAVNAICVFAVSTALFGSAGESYSLLIPQLIILVFGILTFAGLFFMLCSLFKKNAPAVIISLLSLLLIPQGLSLANMALKLKDFDLGILWFGSRISDISTVSVTEGALVGAAICIAVYFAATYIVSIIAVKKTEV